MERSQGEEKSIQRESIRKKNRVGRRGKNGAEEMERKKM